MRGADCEASRRRMHVLELKVPPPVVALLVGVAMWFGAKTGPTLHLPFNLRLAIGIVVALAGGIVALAGEVEFNRAKTTVNPLKAQNASTLVTSGIYRRTRNPMYVGLALVVLGWAAFLCAATALAGPPVFVLYITRFQIEPEERILRAKFGAACDEYLALVRRWI